MSIFSDIVSGVGKVAKTAAGYLGGPVGTALGGPIGGIIGGIAGQQISGSGTVGGTLPALPGGARRTGFTGRSLGGTSTTLRPVYNRAGQLIDYRPTRKRRGRGFSARDIRQTRRMLALVRDVEKSCPKHRTTRAPAYRSRSCR